MHSKESSNVEKFSSPEKNEDRDSRVTGAREGTSVCLGLERCLKKGSSNKKGNISLRGLPATTQPFCAREQCKGVTSRPPSNERLQNEKRTNAAGGAEALAMAHIKLEKALTKSSGRRF